MTGMHRDETLVIFILNDEHYLFLPEAVMFAISQIFILMMMYSDVLMCE